LGLLTNQKNPIGLIVLSVIIFSALGFANGDGDTDVRKH
jgi:hypothetical protein